MIIRIVVPALLVCLLAAAIWQHRRYLHVRREILRDRQPILYAGDTFHALTFVKIRPGSPVVDDVLALRRSIEVQGGGLVVYAGQVGPAAVVSEQIPHDWSALILVQYPSRQAFDRFNAIADYRSALARFENSYTHGVVRPAATNLLVVQGLLLLRLSNIVRFVPSSFPFVPVGDEASSKQRAKMKEMKQLDAFRPLGEKGVVIFNLIKPGNAEQRSADRSYRLEMMSGMAEGGYGPMHMGRAVTVEGDAEFEQFAAVYYPGIDFLQSMIGSTFMSRIGGDKQLGDSLAVVTVPILSSRGVARP